MNEQVKEKMIDGIKGLMLGRIQRKAAELNKEFNVDFVKEYINAMSEQDVKNLAQEIVEYDEKSKKWDELNAKNT